MTELILERRWPQPLTEADMQGMMARVDSCLGIHRLTWCESLLSADGTDLFCHFRGRDAESLRIAMRDAGSPPGRVWACEAHDAPGVGAAEVAAANVVAAWRFDPPVDRSAAPVPDDAEPAGLQRHAVRLLRTYRSNDRLRAIGLYRAPEVESVRIALDEAGRTAEGLWAVRRYAP